MTFEIRERDLVGRIGKLKTKKGSVETPLFFPVVNPAIQLIPPRRIREDFGFEALITNAYLLMNNFGQIPVDEGVHKFLDFDKTIMTDSGAYQILIYGDIETTPGEIVEYQEKIDTDIATILDYPTGGRVTRKYAEKTVEVTLKRAKELFKSRTRGDILWVGPIQGGRYLDLITNSVKEMTKLPFEIYALGSPTEIMQQYEFDLLLDMIMTAKINLPIDKPLHLFGAGHPLMFSLAVALGCDLFDSAAYAIYARKNRYMAEYGTHKLKDLKYFPCPCPKCTGTYPEEVRGLPKTDRESFLAEHNLYVCQAEMKLVKTALKEGRLWELLQMRAHGHPTILQALKKLKKYEGYIEKHSPTAKRSGIFFFNSTDLVRPEVVRHRRRLLQRYSQPQEAKILILMPQTQRKPLHRSRLFQETAMILQDVPEEILGKIHICFYVAPFGVIPLELDEVYPLSQHEIALPIDRETILYVAQHVADYIRNTNYETVLLIHDPKNWNKEVLSTCEKTCMNENINFEYFEIEGEPNKNIPATLKKTLKKVLGEKI